MPIYYSNSLSDTADIAAKVADMLPCGGVIAFTGDLGAGKTAFVSGLAEHLGYTGEVSSPTFAIVQEYVGGRLPIHHFDMYRISGWEDLYTTGYFDCLDGGGVLAVEWSENIAAALPESYISVDISRGDGENERIITVERVGDSNA